MSEQEFHPENSSTSPKRGSSLLRSDGSGFLQAPVPTDRTVISSKPPMSSVNVNPAELEGPFRVGDRLGVYELTEYIGGGGMGSVYKATDSLLAREVAIKILLPEAAGSEEAVLRFQNEARSAARLDHDSIAKVYYVGEEEGLPFLVFEFVAGINLRDLVRQRGPLPLSDAIGISLQVADSLAHASEHGVVHRDVKPSNVLLREDGQVKLIDFGLARIVEVEERDNDLTASGVTLGTFDYISPEQARDPRTVDIRSDIYSLGCSLFYMLTGRPPFPEGTVLQKLLQHQGDRPPNVREFRPELPEEIGLLLDRMLAKDPNNRFQNPIELCDQIGLLASQLGLRSLSLGIKNWTLPAASQPSFLTRHLPWILSVTALLVIVLGLDFYWNRETQGVWDDSAVSVNDEKNPGERVSPFPALKILPDDPTAPPTKTNSGDASQTPGTDEGKVSPVSETPKGNGATSAQRSPPSSEKTNDPSNDTRNPLTTPFSEDFHLEDVKIKSPSYWGVPNTYGINEPKEATTYGDLPIINGESRMPETSDVLDGTFGNKDLTTGWPLFNGNGNRIITNNLNILGMTTRYGFLTVGDPKEGSVSFTSLAAACRAATTGDIIELRYNGERVEQPLLFSGKNLVLRAGEGYKPSIVFRPSKPESTDPNPIVTQSTMVSLGGGSLTAINVSFRLELDMKVPIGRWTLFESQSGEVIQLQKCCLSVKNQSKQTATFFRVAASPSDELTDAGSILGDTPIASAKIDLTDSVARGNATFLVVDDQRPVDCSWENGLLVTDGVMLDLRGSESIWNRKDRIRFSLKHVTVFAASGMVRLGNEHQRPPTIPVDYVCYDSIIMVSNTNAMITQWIDKTLTDPDSRFHYEGDRNYYQNFNHFLVQKDRISKKDLNQLDLSAWRHRWVPDHETYSFGGWFALVETSDASKPLDQRGPTDYALSDNSENPARYAADDGSNLGFLLDRLPKHLTPPKEPLP